MGGENFLKDFWKYYILNSCNFILVNIMNLHKSFRKQLV